ncbi:hypothetical protein GCM10007382_28550 [Salinibacterium xinjiangense]|nr:hypothetical protein GCM10007382_28550 [Salinibacterium xinjiangense]
MSLRHPFSRAVRSTSHHDRRELQTLDQTRGIVKFPRLVASDRPSLPFVYGTFNHLRVRLSDATGHWSIFACVFAEMIGE